MQLLFIVGIVAAIGAVLFALQNNTPVVVSLAAWSFEGSLALVLLCAMAVGALLAGLISTPTVLHKQWNIARLNRRVSKLERKLMDKESRVAALEKELELERSRQPETVPLEGDLVMPERNYVGLRTLLSGEK